MGRLRLLVLRLLVLWLALLTGACAAAEYPDWPLGDRRIMVISTGWHTDIILRAEDIPRETLPEIADFPDARYVMFGWGDRDYYMTPEPGLWITLKAALWPTAAVMHVAGLAEDPQHYFRDPEILVLAVDREVLGSVIAGIAASFARAGDQRASPLGPGLYEDSRFYAATGRFHLFNNCNRWTAQILRRAGLPVSATMVLTEGQVMRQLRRLITDEGVSDAPVTPAPALP